MPVTTAWKNRSPGAVNWIAVDAVKIPSPAAASMFVEMPLSSRSATLPMTAPPASTSFRTAAIVWPDGTWATSTSKMSCSGEFSASTDESTDSADNVGPAGSAGNAGLSTVNRADEAA